MRLKGRQYKEDKRGNEIEGGQTIEGGQIEGGQTIEGGQKR